MTIFSFSKSLGKCQDIFTKHQISIYYHHYHYSTVVTDVTLGKSDHWLGTRAGTGSTATLA